MQATEKVASAAELAVVVGSGTLATGLLVYLVYSLAKQNASMRKQRWLVVAALAVLVPACYVMHWLFGVVVSALVVASFFFLVFMEKLTEREASRP